MMLVLARRKTSKPQRSKEIPTSTNTPGQQPANVLRQTKSRGYPRQGPHGGDAEQRHVGWRDFQFEMTRGGIYYRLALIKGPKDESRRKVAPTLIPRARQRVS